MIARAVARLDVAAYPTPVLADEALDFWAEWYDRNDIASFGVSFLALLQDPLPIACGLADLMPTVNLPAGECGRRLSNVERFRIAELIYRERCQAAAR